VIVYLKVPLVPELNATALIAYTLMSLMVIALVLHPSLGSISIPVIADLYPCILNILLLIKTPICICYDKP
jgi:hypothetical protein